MKYLIINADDFGLSSSVNEGIIRSWEAGGITNTTLMVKRNAADEAVRYAKENPSLSVGLHLDLDELLGKDITGSERFSTARLSAMLEDKRFLDTVECDIEDQIKTFRDTGLRLTHIDGHHHLHALPRLFPLVVDKIVKYDIKTVRFSQGFDLLKYPPMHWDDIFFEEMKTLLKKHDIRHADDFITGWQHYDLSRLKKGTTELMTHPGIEEEWRIKELNLLTSPQWISALEENEIGLYSFLDLAARDLH